MSKKLARLLGAVLVVMLAFSAAAFGETVETVKLKVKAGTANGSQTVEEEVAEDVTFSIGDDKKTLQAKIGNDGTATAVIPVDDNGDPVTEAVALTESSVAGGITIDRNGALAATTADATTDEFKIDTGSILKYAANTVVAGTNNIASTGFEATVDDGEGNVYSMTIKISEAGAISATNVKQVQKGTTFNIAEQEIEGTLTVLTDDTDAGPAYEEGFRTHGFKPNDGQVLAASFDQGTNNWKKIVFEFDKDTTYALNSQDTEGKYTFAFEQDPITSTDDEGVIYALPLEGIEELEIVKDEVAAAAPFDSADIKVFADGKNMGTVTFTSKDAAKSVTVSTDVTVSFDLSKVSFDLVSVDGKGKTSTDLKAAAYVFSTDIESASKDVYIYFTSGDASFEAKLTINVDSSSSATTETYLLKVSDITITPAGAVTNTAKLISADTDNYSANSEPDQLNSTASGDWGSFADFTVSSDYLGGSFSVTVSTDAKLVNVYVKNGTDWDEVDTEELSGKVITPNTIGTYKVVLSADLIASSDKKVSGDAYFAFDFKVVSVDAPAATGDVVVNADNASADPTGGVGGNPIIAGGQKIDTKFLSGTSISDSAFASFFSSATTVTMLSETELAAALDTLGLDETYMGNAEEGYKALAFGLPSGFTLTANEKFFVLLTTNDTGTGNNYLGIGVVPPALNGLRTMVIVFRLLKNPARTADYMTFPAGNYYVGATNDTASADTSSSTRAVFVTADGVFNIKSEEATLLQGQTASGTATPVEDSDDDDDDQETSSHGSSSGCDAGFGALALLAVAGALAARKVRK